MMALIAKSKMTSQSHIVRLFVATKKLGSNYRGEKVNRGKVRGGAWRWAGESSGRGAGFTVYRVHSQKQPTVLEVLREYAGKKNSEPNSNDSTSLPPSTHHQGIV